MSQPPPVPNTPFLHPTTQHLLASVAAIGAAVVLPTYLSPDQASLLAGAAGAVGGLGQNLFSGFIQRFFDRRENDPTCPDLNRDLDIRLLGDAIVEEIIRFSDDTQATLASMERSRCRLFAGKIGPAFDELIRNNELPDITPPDFTQLLAAAAHEHDLPPVGTFNDWLQIVGRLHTKCNGNLHINTLKEIAVRLHRNLWTSIRSRLKSDFATDGRAYAALHLSFMGGVLRNLHGLTDEVQLTNAQLAEFRTHKEQQADPKVAALLATLAQDNSTLATQFTDYFTQLNGQLDGHFQRLSVQLQRIEAKLDNVVVDKLLARVSEKDQEIGRLSSQQDQLKAQLQAALQRLAEAETKGNVSAGETLAQLRQDGDPTPLGAFLDQQLAEKQPDIIALLRERAAVAYVSGDIARAEHCLRQILATLPDDLAATNELGHIYSLHGDLPAAEKQYQRLLELVPDDEAVKAAALGNLGLIYRTQGKLAEAEQYLRDALAIHQQLGRLAGQAIALVNLGVIYQTQGKLAEAEQFHRDALAIHQQLGRLAGQASDLGNLGVIYQTQGKLAEAEQFHRDALAIHQQLGRLAGQAIELGNLGLIAEERGDIAEARQLWTEARDLFARVGMAPQVKQVESWLAGLPK